MDVSSLTQLLQSLKDCPTSVLVAVAVIVISFNLRGIIQAITELIQTIKGTRS